MEVRNRMEDVVKLRCNVCQDFLRMKFSSGWQQLLYKECQIYKTGRFKGNYKPTYEKMREIGEENYKIEDMDITIMSSIISGGKLIAVSDKTKAALRRITEDRNLKSHSGENEETEELYLLGLLALCDLKFFVRTVDENEIDIDDQARLSYRRDYIEKIDSLMSVLDNERIELRDMNMRIQEILDSKEPWDTWHDTEQYYYKRYVQKEDDKDKYDDFIVRASDAGISHAHGSACYYYLMKNIDIAEAQRRLVRLYDSIDDTSYDFVEEILFLVNSYLQEGYEINDEMKRIIDGVSARTVGYSLVKNSNGFYERKSIRT